MPKPDDRFPEVVLHGAARLNPRLKVYYERLPRTMSHSGGYYTMTKENWPLIGPAWPYGRFVVGVISGFGTFAALRQDVWPPHWQRGQRRRAMRTRSTSLVSMPRVSLQVWRRSLAATPANRSDCTPVASPLTFAPSGEVSERFKEHAWKVCVR